METTAAGTRANRAGQGGGPVRTLTTTVGLRRLRGLVDVAGNGVIRAMIGGGVGIRWVGAASKSCYLGLVLIL